MQQLQISIEEKDVFREISLHTAYAAGKSTNKTEDFNRLATAKCDERILSRLWNEVCGDITERFREFITVYSFENGVFSLTMTVSGFFDPALTPSVVADISNAVTEGVLSKWFRYSFPERAQEWDTLSQSHINSAYAKLCQRRKPVRRSLEKLSNLQNKSI